MQSEGNSQTVILHADDVSQRLVSQLAKIILFSLKTRKKEIITDDINGFYCSFEHMWLCMNLVRKFPINTFWSYMKLVRLSIWFFGFCFIARRKPNEDIKGFQVFSNLETLLQLLSISSNTRFPVFILPLLVRLFKQPLELYFFVNLELRVTFWVKPIASSRSWTIVP